MALPNEFWEPNEYNVRGGIENGTLGLGSCTL